MQDKPGPKIKKPGKKPGEKRAGFSQPLSVPREDWFNLVEQYPWKTVCYEESLRRDKIKFYLVNEGIAERSPSGVEKFFG